MQQLQIPPTTEGETYIGAIGDKNGDVHHVILLPGDNDDVTFADALEWAKNIGGDLPSKVEAAMLFEQAKGQFNPAWYWTNATFVDPDDEDDGRYAWGQLFDYGTQHYYRKGYELRARAVRRVFITQEQQA